MNPLDPADSSVLNRDSFVPLYHQLYELLRSQIDTGQYKPGEQLPTEAEFAATYKISQVTIRNALNMLMDAGVIYRRKGQGTFVAPTPIASNLTQLVSVEDDFRQRDVSFRVVLMKAAAVPVSQKSAQTLQIEVGEELVAMERLFLVDDKPICYEGCYLVHRYCAGILSQLPVETPFSTMLAQKYGLIATKSEQIIRARTAGVEHGKLLHMAPQEPVLFIDRVVYSHRNIPFMLTRIFARGDQYELRLGVS